MSEITHAAPSGVEHAKLLVFADCGVVVGAGPPSPKWASARQPSLPAGLPSRSSEGAKAGGARRDRTDDLMLAKHALSQLSYGPKPENEVIGDLPASPRLACRAVASGPSPPSPKRASARQPSLRYACEGWWAWEDLNFRPHAYQARALTN
jgi:hypothetical protein